MERWKFSPSRIKRLAYKASSYLISFVIVLSNLLGSFVPAQAAGVLTVEIIAAPNLIVDSNVLSPSSYQPIVATVIGKFCNTGDADLTNVTAFIGDYIDGTNDTPGTYPVRTDPSHGSTNYDGDYYFSHLGGSADAKRIIPLIEPGEQNCVHQYWSFTYPKTAIDKDSGKTIPGWGNSVKPDDDLEIAFDIWANDGVIDVTATHTATLRNEISAMANKIEPNGNPGGRWFNTDTNTVYPGDTVTTNGILYRLGNVNKGFDNDGNGIPDYNAWLQPFGDPSYDPSCFRLVSTHGVLTVTQRSGQTIIPFKDTLYFTDLPPDNTNVWGEVFYTFLALGGACTIPISPYQEVASGSDNEKFNGDYGEGGPDEPVGTFEPEVTVDKNGEVTITEGGTITYSMPFDNPGSTSAGLTLSVGGINAPVMIEDTVPISMTYEGNSAATTFDVGNTSATSATIYFSTDGGDTWSTTDPGDTLSTAANPVVIQWWLDAPLDPGEGGDASFQASIAATYIQNAGDPFIENCATGGFGDAPPFEESCTTTMVTGDNKIGDFVWQDEDSDGSQDAGEAGINGMLVWLYWDKDGDGELREDIDELVFTATTALSGTVNGSYEFDDLPNGDFLVKVNTTDDSVPTGYGPTTSKVVAVTLTDANPNYWDADFGFGPSLKINKYRTTTSPAYVVTDEAYTGEYINFIIELTNQLPGDGTSSGYCTYDIWTDSATTEGSPKDFQTFLNSEGPVDYSYASSDFSTGANAELHGAGYTGGTRTSGITKVEVLSSIYLASDLEDDTMNLVMTSNENLGSTGNPSASNNFGTATLNGYSGSANQGFVTWDVSNLGPGGTWEWGDFNANLILDVTLSKTGSADEPIIYVDAFGFRVTSNDTSCGGTDTTIVTLPFTDTYDADHLEFVSANPVQTSSSTSGSSPNTVGTLTWNNLGPLYAGGTTSIEVTFIGISNTNLTTNTAIVTNAKFGNGLDVNDDNDDATVEIKVSGSITGTVWADADNSGWDGTTGYTAGESGIPGVSLDLYGCFDATTGLLIGSSATNKTCEDSQVGGVWTYIKSVTTNGLGRYEFDGLRDGYYDVRLDSSTLPAGFTDATVEPDPSDGQSGFDCSTCDGRWSTESNGTEEVVRDLDFLGLDSSDNPAPGETITDISFGFRDAAGNDGAVVGYVWHDQDSGGAGDWDGTEPPIANITVTLDNGSCSPSCPTTLTDENGFYSFGNVDPGNYTVVITPPSGMSQTADPDATEDNQTSVTVVAHTISGPYNFGYNGGLSVGDTVYTDWNGNGQKDTGDDGISGVSVYLYRDVDGDGVINTITDTLYAVTTTITGGTYHFRDVAGNGTDYIVLVGESSLPAGYTQTGDPDEVGTCSTCDAKDPLTLTSTDYADADFGYQPTGYGSISNYVWDDYDADQMQDSTEDGISGVVVNLYHDFNGNGTIESGDALIITTTTMGYTVIAGAIDINGDGSITAADTYPALQGVDIITGTLDLNGDGLIDERDDGTFVGYTVIDGYIDLDSDNVADGTDTGDSGDLNGMYQFINLPADSFIVEIDQTEFDSSGDLDGYTLTLDDSVYTNTTSQTSYKVTLTDGEEHEDADFGFATSAIGDLIWQDNDGDGFWDVGEPGIEGVEVQLYQWIDDGDGVYEGSGEWGSLLYTDTTDADGYYEFTGLISGTYAINVVASSTPTTTNGTLTYDPDAYADNGDPYPEYVEGTTYVGLDGHSGVSLRLGQIIRTMDYGYRPLGSIGDRVWIDTDGDGVVDGDEGGISDVDVWLCTSSTCNASTAILTATTNADGEYSFGGLTNGQTYYVEVNTNDSDFPGGLSQTYDPESSCPGAGCDDQSSHQIDTGTNDGIYLDMDFGYRFAGNNQIGGTVWHDTNEGGNDGGTGDINITETVRYEGVPIYLWYCGDPTDVCGDGDDILVGSTTTDASGVYTFTSLAPGTYRVIANKNDTSLIGTTETGYTDFNGADGTNNAAVDTVIDGSPATRDFGFKSDVDMGDLPSNYNNTTMSDNGARHEIPTSGAIYFGSTQPDVDADGQESSTATGDDTDSGTGDFDDDDGIVMTPDLQWVAGTDGASIDINATCQGVCFMNAWIDWNNDGDFNDPNEHPFIDEKIYNGDQTLTFDMPAGVDNVVNARFRLYNGNQAGFAQPTGYAFNGEVEDHQWDLRQGTIGDFIWLDSNGDGVQDAGEPGIAGVVVTATLQNGSVLTTTTNASGAYDFTGLYAGTYTITVSSGTLPAGLTQTGDPDGCPGATCDDQTVVSLSAGQDYNTADFGYRGPSSLGDYVWFDNDNDGIQDTIEPGVGNVTLNIRFEGADGTFNTADDIVFTDTTDATGFYRADGLPNGDYQVDVDDSTVPDGYVVHTTDPLTFNVTNQFNRSFDFGIVVGASIGDYVWLDENGDGIQDAGEDGISNIVIEVYNSSGTLVVTTTTDFDGGYFVDGLLADTYTITVKSSSLPAGLYANPTYDEDDGDTNPDSETVKALSLGEEHHTADFGFNWGDQVDTPPSGATGAIGDRVWADANGDGVQDPGEPGLGGITVRLYTDPDGDGVYDNLAGTATTTDDGNYIFDGLLAGSYVVEVNSASLPANYSQTGDPDSTTDHKTTAPVVLAPGDVFVNADFGYQRSTSYTIGNTIFVDANGDGSLDAGEPGISNVTVSLLDASGDVIATTRTDENGEYTFTGVISGTYTVWVNDSGNVINGLVQSSEPNSAADGGQACGTCNDQNTITITGSDTYQDFGYVPVGHSSGEGLIGDTIFLDYDSSGTPDTGEGIEGVVVELTDSSNNTFTTTTNENGQYFFGNLDTGATYTVKVDTSTLPGGVTNTVDPDNTAPLNQSVVDLSGYTDGVALDQDFAYEDQSDPNSISGTIWEDADADGTLEGGETGRFAGVTVVLLDINNNIVAITTTNSSGDFKFPGLPDGTYKVDVTDDDKVLNGYWHSPTPGGQSGNDGYSQSDPYSVAVTGGENNTTADFGYYKDPATLGNIVWLDRSDDGIQDTNEPGIRGITVTLTITYPTTGGDTVITLVTTTGVNGFYSFENLLFDEDYNGDGSGSEPEYLLSISTPPGMTNASVDAGGNDKSDSDQHSGVDAQPIQGVVDVSAQDPVTDEPDAASYDFGFTGVIDLGDLPSPYPTTFSPGPSHVIFPMTAGVPTTTNNVPAVWLGAIVDTELDGQPNANAQGDDNNGDDEDGMTYYPSEWIPTETGTVTITLNSSEAGTTVFYGLWIDWNLDGAFEAFYSGSGVASSPVVVTQTIDIPFTYFGGEVYLRIRALDEPVSSSDYQGTFVNGEVEDYSQTFGPTAVSLVSFSGRTLNSGWMIAILSVVLIPVTVALIYTKRQKPKK